MQDLNDYFYFARVIEHGGFAQAARVVGIPKSTLSRRISLLEQRLGVRLIQRSTRRFSMTEIGQVFYQHCLSVLSEAEAAEEAIEHLSGEVRGTIRVTCPLTLLTSSITPIVSRFLKAYPFVTIHLSATNRRISVIEEGVDIALRVRFPPLDSESLVMRHLAESSLVLVGSPELLDKIGRPETPDELTSYPAMSLSKATPKYVWDLHNDDGDTVSISFTPRYMVGDMMALRQGAIDGVGIVELADYLIEDQLRDGTLERLLPAWHSPKGIIHAVFPSKSGLSPAVRSFIDFLGQEFLHRSCLDHTSRKM